MVEPRKTHDKPSKLSKRATAAAAAVSTAASKLSKRATIAAAVGTAAAAVAASLAARKVRANSRSARRQSHNGAVTILRVKPHGEGWALFIGDNRSAARTFEVKKRAVDSARELAHKNAPSELVIHRTDGSTQSKHQYAE
jgi:hypothetical protein